MITCPACKKEHIESLDNCNICAFPFNGTEKERAIHIGRFINTKGVLIDSVDSIKRSQMILFVIAGFNTLLFLINFFLGSIFLLDIALIGIFLLCGILIRKSPILFICIPLVLIIGINISNYFIDPSLAFNGIFIKILIVSSLIYSIYIILKANKFKKRYEIN